jgi:HSP20 family protein
MKLRRWIMDFKKLAPWNWFKKEEEGAGADVPVKRTHSPARYPDTMSRHPVLQLHQEMDRLFDKVFRGFGLSPLSSEVFTPLEESGLLKPQVDVGATEKEYSITVEVPGVNEKDIKVEITNNTMTIKGEKRQEKEAKDKGYYRMERSYGSFQRVLSLPEDADHANIQATFKNGVLTVIMPRRALSSSHIKQIEIKDAA